MPTSLLKFKLPEETQEMQTALAGGELLSSLEEIGRHLRQVLKYGDPPDDVRKALEEVRSLLPFELMERLS